MRIGSLFSGAGGLDMAVEAVFGGRTVWQSELNPAASAVLAARFGVPNLGDITAVDWNTVEPVDVLCGGFPCQDVSAAGKRAGIRDGTRSGLWTIFADAIAALRPPIVVIENVRGLLSATAHRPMEPDTDALGDGDTQPVLRAIGAVLGDLADIGYDAQWATISAASIGACHKRERVFILATDTSGDGCERGPQRDLEQAAELEAPQRNNADRRSGDAVALLPTPDANNGARGPRSAEALTRRAIGGERADRQKSLDDIGRLLPTPTSRDHKGHNQRNDDTCLTGALLPTPTARNAHGGVDQYRAERASGGPDLLNALLPTPGASDGTGGGQHPDKRVGHSRQLIDYVLLCTPSASDGAGGKTSRSGSRIDEPLLGGQAREMSGDWGKYGAAIEQWEAVTRPAPAPTEPNRNGNPRLNPAFSEWMMGWPKGWVTDLVPSPPLRVDPDLVISRNDALRIGNGVCPQQAHAAIRSLLSVCGVAA